MNILVLKPGTHRVDWTLFESGRSRAVQAGHTGACRGASDARAALAEIANRIGAEAGLAEAVDAVAMRLPFGGEQFTGPVLATEETLGQLDALWTEAPLHLPPADRKSVV